MALVKLLAITLMVYGLVKCFLGFKLFKLLLGITGFLVGTAWSTAVLYLFFLGARAFKHGTELPFALFLGVAIGVVVGALMYKAYMLGVFLFGAGCGFALGLPVCAVARIREWVVVCLVLAVVAGVLAVKFEKFAIITTTSILGGFMVVFGLAAFRSESIRQVMWKVVSPGALLFWVVLGVLGVLYQYQSLKKATRGSDGVPAHGVWDLNLGKTVCESCGAELPRVRRPANLRQALWGGWTCPKCAAELDKWGKILKS